MPGCAVVLVSQSPFFARAELRRPDSVASHSLLIRKARADVIANDFLRRETHWPATAVLSAVALPSGIRREASCSECSDGANTSNGKPKLLHVHSWVKAGSSTLGMRERQAPIDDLARAAGCGMQQLGDVGVFSSEPGHNRFSSQTPMMACRHQYPPSPPRHTLDIFLSAKNGSPHKLKLKSHPYICSAIPARKISEQLHWGTV